MQESVSRLKQLLLDEEHRDFDQLKRKVEQLSDKAVTRDRMREHVAEVLDGSIRDAEGGDKRKDLESAMATVTAPIVRDEIRHSTNDIAEALEPHIGAMVKAYVKRAFNEMMAKINSSLESGLSLKRWKLKLRSWRTGKSERELLLREVDRMRIDELYLIRRGSGDMIQHWVAEDLFEAAGGPVEEPGTADARMRARSNRDASVAAVLTGIENVIKETFDLARSTNEPAGSAKRRRFMRL